MGLTQDVGEEGVKFEVWVRHAARTRDCITLQAKDREGKVAWTHDVAHLLWTHAINNTGTAADSCRATLLKVSCHPDVSSACPQRHEQILAAFSWFANVLTAPIFFFFFAVPRTVSKGVALCGDFQ